jgi:hypothetical protein
MYGKLTPCSRILLEKLTVAQLVNEFIAFLWDLKFYYRFHNSPPLILILSQINPLHIIGNLHISPP